MKQKIFDLSGREQLSGSYPPQKKKSDVQSPILTQQKPRDV